MSHEVQQNHQGCRVRQRQHCCPTADYRQHYRRPREASGSGPDTPNDTQQTPPPLPAAALLQLLTKVIEGNLSWFPLTTAQRPSLGSISNLLAGCIRWRCIFKNQPPQSSPGDRTTHVASRVRIDLLSQSETIQRCQKLIDA